MPPNYTGLQNRTIALVGLMGAGKTTIGRRLARELNMPFYDSDDEIIKASGRSVAGYFFDHGEEAFRDGERRVIERLISDQPIILATGGGAFIPEKTRRILNDKATTVWLKGDLDTLMKRVKRTDHRPLLQVANPRAKMQELMDVRYPIYAKAHITVPLVKGPHKRTLAAVIKALNAHNAAQKTDI